MNRVWAASTGRAAWVTTLTSFGVDQIGRDPTGRDRRRAIAAVFAITGMRKFAKPRAVILGSGFDEAKVAKVYPPELHRRISAAEHLPEFIHVTEEEVLRVRALQKG